MKRSISKGIDRMFVTIEKTAALMALLALSSCAGEVKEKIKKAKQGVSNMTTIAEKAQEAKEDIEKLKDATPLTNEELKIWLPKELAGWQRSGFKVGTTGYVNVASIEGTYKTQEHDETHVGNGVMSEKKLTVNIIDGAGPSGSMMIAGLGMASKMDMEEENEYKHTKGVTVNGIRAQQTFHKKRNETALQFVCEKRFGVMVNGVNMGPEETWEMIKKLDLEKLIEMTE